MIVHRSWQNSPNCCVTNPPFRQIAAFLCVLMFVTSCTAAKTVKSAKHATTVVVRGLNGPTQFQQLDGNRLLIAQLNGDENAKTGQVLVVDRVSGAKTVLLSDLDKPTGVLFHSGALWVMTRDNLQRADWDGIGIPGPIEAVLQPLPNNGRSEGTLTVMADDRIAYETTGNIIAGQVVASSGRLWAYDPAMHQSSILAIGAKNAYAHAVLPDGQLVIAEIGDNIENPPVEELNIIPIADVGQTSVNLGWPECPGDKTCGGVVTPLATFPPKATPAGVALSADGLIAYVSLLTRGELVAVNVVDGSQRVVVSELELPLHVVMGDDGQLLVGEHGTGRIVSINP
jgi:glucose/arabinose dehydrogenase